MKSQRRMTDGAAVAKSLRELELLFGKKPPDRNDNAAGKSGAGKTGKQNTRGATS